jgi:hypothetical protein
MVFSTGVGLMQSVVGLNRKEKLPLLPLTHHGRLLPAFLFEIGCQGFPAFTLELKHLLFLGLGSEGLWTGRSLLFLPVLMPSVIGSSGPPA